jgi:hypothetical protein
MMQFVPKFGTPGVLLTESVVRNLSIIIGGMLQIFNILTVNSRQPQNSSSFTMQYMWRGVHGYCLKVATIVAKNGRFCLW